MQAISKQSPLVLTAFVLVGLPIALAAQATSGQEPDPVQLLKDAAQAVADAESATTDFVVTTTLVRDEMRDEMSGSFLFSSAPEGRFEFISVDPDGGAPTAGYRVAGNSKVVLTALLGRKRHMIEENTAGIATFVRSPAAEGIGSGLGGLALAFLSPEAMKDLVGSVIESEYLGTEEIDDEKLIHAKYLVGGGVPVDIWFLAEGAPLVRRIVPDLLATPGVQQMAARFEKFDYQLRFDFENWNTKAGLTAEEVQVVEPKGSLLLGSLYQRPPRGPHSTLGKIAKPFELASTSGELAGISEPSEEGAVLLEFWTTTCPICIQAMPALEQLHEEYAEQGLKYYAVNVGESSERVSEFLEQRGLTPTALLDGDAEVATAYDVGPIPLILLVGPDGRVQIAQEGFGPNTPDKLKPAIEATLRGEDVAGPQLEVAKREADARKAERERLRSLLDG